MATRPRDAARLLVTLLAPAASRAAARGLGPWLARVAPRRARGAVTVALVSDARMRTLNRGFRGVDHATDVLSFPAGGGRSTGAREAVRPDGPAELGDIAIATGIAARQARAAGHTVSTECRVLALHGLLHLLGFDHESDGGRMARTEARLRRVGKLREGLIERARSPRPAPGTRPRTAANAAARR